MYQKVRIIFTLLSCVFVLAAFFLGIFFGLTPFLICAGIAAALFLVVVYVKKKQEQIENPPAPLPDFFHPLEKQTDETAEKSDEE